MTEALAANSKTAIARFVYEKREEILNEWLSRVRREVVTAADLSTPILVNTIPLFIERLAESLAEESPLSSATENATFAQEHGGERARITRYGPEQIIQESAILRRTVRAKILSAMEIRERDENIIQLSFDKALQESLLAYFLVYGRIREQFVAGLTHDLRNPIGAIKLAADLIADTAASSPTSAGLEEIQILTGKITNAVKRSERMIQDMLDASLVQVGETLSLKISEGDIRNVVLAAINERSETERRRIHLETIRVHGFWDLEAFRRAIENLVTNAVKYGDPNRMITVSVKTANERVMVSVHNFGNPIPAEDMESLFQVFRRARSAKLGESKGWGIGLALARATAEQMGGSIGVESSLEDGTTFTIDVPLDVRPLRETNASPP